MAVKGYDNIYDFSRPDEMQKPGDAVLQPVHNQQFVRPEYNRGTAEHDLPSNYLKYLFNDKDPESEAQIPSLSLDSEKPNQPPRKAFLSEQTPEPDSKDDRELDENLTELTKYPAPHQAIQVQQLPDPYIEVIASSIVAEYNLQNSPIELDFGNTKIAWTLPELVDATSRLSLKYKPKCDASFKRVRAKNNRYDFHVTCGEDWSDPKGHIVKVKFVPEDKRIKQGLKSPVLVSCSCKFWRYYGCDYNSLRDDYNERQMGNGAAPNIRGKNHMICKHVAACVPLIKFVFLKRK